MTKAHRTSKDRRACNMHLTCLQHDSFVKAIARETILLAKKLVCPPPQLLSHRCH